jgi:putative DNA primase/helicase
MEAKGISIHAGALASGKTLCVPGHDAGGKIKTMVYIQEDGVKRYAKDSHKEGAFHAVGGMDALKKAPVLIVAEGYATAASIAEAVGHATVSAFDAGNLKHVVKALHKAMPDKPIVVAGDNDRHLEEQGKPNRGKLAAIDAANSVGGVTVFPTFPENDYAKDPKGLTDFNDMVNKTSLDKTTAQEHVKASMSHEAVQAKAQLQERSQGKEEGKERKAEIERQEAAEMAKNTGMTR